METLPWFWIWVGLAGLLFIGEMLSLSFFLLPFAIGAVFAAIASVIGVDLLWQIVVFLVVSIIALLAMRPLAKRLTRAGGDARTGAERLVGLSGKVVEGQSKAGGFRVVVEGDAWNAITPCGTQLEPGASIRVTSVNGNSLVVEEIG